MIGRLVQRVPLWPAFGAVSVLVLLLQLPGNHATAWHYFDDAAHLLLGDSVSGGSTGLRLYADRPDFQFGPLSIVAAVPFALLGSTAGRATAMVASSALGLVALGLLLASIRRLCPVPHATALVAGLVFVVTWGDVAVRTAHLDDALALAATAAGVWCCVHGRAGWAIVALGAAAAAKPWAIAFAPLVLIVPAPPVRRAVRPAVVAAIAVATWAPFVLVEPATLDTSSFGISNDPTSVLRALGVTQATTPEWSRPVQLAGGVAVAAVLVLAGRWHAAILAAVAWRLLFEPGANRYYTIAFVLGALLVELIQRPGRLPWLTVAAAAVLEATAVPDFPPGIGRYLRLAVVAGALLAAGRSSHLRRGVADVGSATGGSMHRVSSGPGGA